MGLFSASMLAKESREEIKSTQNEKGEVMFAELY